MRLVTKLIVAFALVIVLVLALATVALNSLTTLRNATTSTEHSYRMVALAESIRAHINRIQLGQRGFAFTADEAFLVPYNEAKQAFSDTLAQLQQGMPEEKKRLDAIAERYQIWLEQAVDPIIDIRDMYGPGSYGLEQVASMIARDEGAAGLADLNRLVDDFNAAVEQRLAASKRGSEQVLSTATWVLWLGSALVIVIAIAAAVVMRRQLNHRLRAAVAIAEAVAAGRLDQAIDETGRDEIAVLLSSLANMQTQLRHMLSEIRQTASELNNAGDTVSTTAEQLSASSDEQSNASNAIATSVQQLSASIQHVADNAQQAQRISTESRDNTEQSSLVMEQMVASITRIDEVVRAAASRVRELGQQSQEINAIVGVIKGIADQTNLLALNAAIEAARAGEQGRGFSVVADEVRTLAQRTSSSTDDIERMVGQIQQGTHATVKQIEQGVDAVAQGVDYAAQAGSAITEIRDSFERVLAVVADISQVLAEQHQASAEVARHVDGFAGMAQQNKEATQHTSVTAHQLQLLANQLNQAIARFRV
ncbi:methyl-accepting chemotaxis protein [Idiomarina xiamenensis]|uniref:Methyl-accepting chemotaxis transducer n=1 Tax=Idiomarina xiamenensis 10-D-4 TaxID=740709 RepID=K2KSL2_9GAMM|nr:methyl-accepting chemotaxis protein [Idiomarina xiamenensis]EKE85414.1 methyl-accepting chemotaxis transducer [Idiomarina xiamenensis 10-D-4]